MDSRRSRACAGLIALVGALAFGGCGGDESRGTPALTGGTPPGEGGTLVWAVADPVRTVDPLGARARSERLVSAQIHPPLVSTVAGPLGDTRQVPGLALRVRPSADASIWTARLRSGVTFQDGTSFNSAAVLANAERWRTTAAGAALAPGLVAADSPRPGLVRFVLAGPDPSFDERLAAPGLGIVSPRALRPRSGAQATMRRSQGTGTGAFELRERSRTRLLLARNVDWWGATVAGGLGPALEQLEFRIEPSSAVRFALLDAGDVQLADELGLAQARHARLDPLLDVLPGGGGTWLGVERSVRGVTSARDIPSLSGAWLTRVTAAG